MIIPLADWQERVHPLRNELPRRRGTAGAYEATYDHHVGGSDGSGKK